MSKKFFLVTSFKVIFLKSNAVLASLLFELFVTSFHASRATGFRDSETETFLPTVAFAGAFRPC